MKDPVVEEVHRCREERAKKFNHDIDAMIKDLQDSEAESRLRGAKFVMPEKRKSSS